MDQLQSEHLLLHVHALGDVGCKDVRPGRHLLVEVTVRGPLPHSTGDHLEAAEAAKRAEYQGWEGTLVGETELHCAALSVTGRWGKEVSALLATCANKSADRQGQLLAPAASWLW